MVHPPHLAPEKKTSVVLAVIASDVKGDEAARKEGASEALIPNWKNGFLEAGRQALAAGGGQGPSNREVQLEAEVADLTQALGEAAVELRVWKKSAVGRLGPSRTLR